jgi:hypothetical protein
LEKDQLFGSLCRSNDKIFFSFEKNIFNGFVKKLCTGVFFPTENKKRATIYSTCNNFTARKKFFRQAELGETKLKGGVLNGKKESKKGGAQGKEGSEAQGKKGGKASPINLSPPTSIGGLLF